MFVCQFGKIIDIGNNGCRVAYGFNIYEFCILSDLCFKFIYACVVVYFIYMKTVLGKDGIQTVDDTSLKLFGGKHSAAALAK